MRNSECWMFIYDVEFVLLIVSYVQSWRNEMPCRSLSEPTVMTRPARGIVLCAVLAVPVAVSIGP